MNWLIFIAGLIMGFLITCAVIDDLEEFSIPGTGKAWVRKPEPVLREL